MPADSHADQRSLAGDGLVLAPFGALRYHDRTGSGLGLVTSPPYDVVNAAGVERLRAGHPHNIVRLILPRAEDDVAATLRQWLDEEVLVGEDAPALYIYEYVVDGHTVRGLVGALALRDYAEAVVLPHEDVMQGPVAGRTDLMRRTRANLEPILLVYDGDGAASDAVDCAVEEPPMISAVADDGTSHAVWRIDDEDALAAIATDLAPRQALIADGHHRYAAYLNRRREDGGDWAYGLAMLVDQRRHPLRLAAVHRVAPRVSLDAARRSSDLSWVDVGTDPTSARHALELQREGHALLLTDGHSWTLLHGRGTGIDTALLHDDLLPRWGVDDAEVLYVHDAEHAQQRARETDGLAIVLRPPSIEAVLSASSQGQMLPRKTTSFGPKPRTGLLLRLVD